MRKKLCVLVSIGFLFTMCKSKKVITDTAKNPKEQKEVTEEKTEKFYTEDIRNDFRAVSEKSKQKFLKGYRATDAKYSILFFTQGFNNDEVIVKNDEGVLYKGNVKTNNQTGLAKNMRILNILENHITDNSTGITITVSPELSQKYKFIYVMKKTDADVPYKITYSNLLRPKR